MRKFCEIRTDILLRRLISLGWIQLFRAYCAEAAVFVAESKAKAWNICSTLVDKIREKSGLTDVRNIVDEKEICLSCPQVKGAAYGFGAAVEGEG